MKRKDIPVVKAKAKLKAWDYMVRGKGFDEKVLCKCCGAVLVSLIPHKTFQRNGKTIEQMVMAQTPAYQQVDLEFDDGSAHSTVMCKGCAGNLKPEDYESIYAADMDDFVKLEKKGAKIPWEMFEGRKPVGHKVI